MAISTAILLMSMLVVLPLSAFALIMLALSSAKIAIIETGGTEDENNIWN